MAEIVTAACSVVIILLSLFVSNGKQNRQGGRIEEGVRGLYGRVDRIEKWIDGRDRTRR